MDAEKMMMQKRIDNLCEQLEMLKNKLEEEKANHQHTLECAQQFEKDWLQMKCERDAAVKAIKFHKFCIDCAHSTIIFSSDGTWVDCPKRDGRCSGHELWEWRGLCAENGGAEDA